MNTAGLAVFEPRRWTREEIDLIKRTVVPQGATDAEFKLLLYQAARTGLDPLSRQIHLVKRPDGQGNMTCTIQTGIDGFRVVSERTGRYEGQLGPFWCGADGEWREVWTEDVPPAAAKVGILRAGWREPSWGVAHWSEYAQFTKEGRLTRFWQRMGPLMLAKCAEAAAHRKAFPNDLSGIYAPEEMGQAEVGGNTIDTTAHEPGQEGAPSRAQGGQRRGASAPRRDSTAVPRDSVGTEASPQDADPRDLLRQQLGAHRITGSSLAILLDPFEAVDVAGLKAADARRLADVLAGIEAKGEDAAREAVEKMGGGAS